MNATANRPLPPPVPPSATPLADLSRVPGTVLHRFRRGRRRYSLVVFPHALAIVKTAPGSGGLFGWAVAAAIASRRQARLDRAAAQGLAGVAAAFPRAELIDLRLVQAVQVRTGILTQRIVTIHVAGAEPSHLPFPRAWHPLAELWHALAPVLGPRVVIDPDVAAAG